VTTSSGVKDALGNHGTTFNTPTYELSQVAVGGGRSDVATVSSASMNSFGYISFDNTNTSMRFSGTNPDGEIVVTRIVVEGPYAADDASIADDDVDNEYFVVRNFGANRSSLGVMQMKFKSISEMSGDEQDTLNKNFSLYKRASNGYGAWNKVVSDTTNIDAEKGIVAFNASPLATSFSQFVITNSGNLSILPIELLRFEAELKESNVQLNWVAVEDGLSHYEVERSLEGTTFVGIETVYAKGGTSSYEAEDDKREGVVYYRLKMVEDDGTVTYSHVLAVEYHEESSVLLYPNPTSGILNIEMDAGHHMVILFDVSGRELLRFESDSPKERIDVSDLPSGVYVLRIDNESYSFIRH